jgi:hypothetical protein
MTAFASTQFSFTPGFSAVERHFTFARNRLNGFFHGLASITGLKAGVNKRCREEQLV